MRLRDAGASVEVNEDRCVYALCVDTCLGIIESRVRVFFQSMAACNWMFWEVSNRRMHFNTPNAM